MRRTTIASLAAVSGLLLSCNPDCPDDDMERCQSGLYIAFVPPLPDRGEYRVVLVDDGTTYTCTYSRPFDPASGLTAAQPECPRTAIAPDFGGLDQWNGIRVLNRPEHVEITVERDGVLVRQGTFDVTYDEVGRPECGNSCMYASVQLEEL